MSRAWEWAAAAKRLDSLIAAQQFQKAVPALEEYGQAFEQALRDLPPGDPMISRMAGEWQLSFETMRRRVLAARAQAAAGLVRLTDVQQFSHPDPQPPHVYDLLG